MMFRMALAAGSLAACLAPAAADCRQDVQDLLKAAEEWTDYRITTETLMGGTAVQHSTQHYADYSHFYQHVEETGVHWLVLGNQEYLSKDGVTFTPHKERSENWLEEQKALNAAVRESVRDAQCSTVELDGKPHRLLHHVQETKEPVETISVVQSWVDEASGRLVRREAETEAHGQKFSMIYVYEWDVNVTLPDP